MKNSLADCGPLFVGLQETRLPQSEVQPDPDYYILNATSTDRGVGGCALWISKHVPLCHTSQGPVFVRQQDITVVAASPRHLVAVIQTPQVKLQVHVLHAPSVHAVPPAEVKSFWDLRAREVLNRVDGADYLILCDANSGSGDAVSDLVGDHGAEIEGVAGALFHTFLSTIDAIAPSTWACYHTGEHHTWRSALGGRSRIDYILVPRQWHNAQLISHTLPDVELLQLREDHIPVQLICRFVKATPPAFYQTSTKKELRPDVKAARGEAPALLRTVACHPWTDSVDAHYAHLVADWTTVSNQLAQPAAPMPRQPYIAAPTLDIVAERQELRAWLRHALAERCRRWLLIGFAAFIVHRDGLCFNPAQISVAEAWLHDLDRAEAVALANYRRLARALRRAVAIDRAAYLDSLAHNITHHSLRDPKELYRSLRKAFPAARSARRSGILPLPMLRMADDTTASSTAARAEAWRAHFADQEAGTKICPEDYPSAFDSTTIQAHTLDMRVVPSLGVVERLILAAKRARAVGPDGVSAEFL